MRSLPPDLEAAFKAQVATTCVLLDMYLLDAANNPYNVFYTDFDDSVSFNGNTYTPFPFRLMEFSQTISGEVDTLKLLLDNVSLIPASLFLNNEQRGREVVVWFCALDANWNAIGAYEVFRGFINTVSIREQVRTSVTEIEVTHELARWRKETLRQHYYRCPWRFRDVNCAYTGTATFCDKTYERCKQLGNTPNFGGFHNLSDIEEKEIWWGRSPG